MERGATINMGMQMKARRLSGSACVHFVFVISRHFSGCFCLNYVTSASVGARLNNSWARGVRVFIRDRNKKRTESSWRMRFLYNIHWAGKSAGFLSPDRITWSPFYNWHGKNRIWYLRKSGHTRPFQCVSFFIKLYLLCSISVANLLCKSICIQ